MTLVSARLLFSAALQQDRVSRAQCDPRNLNQCVRPRLEDHADEPERTCDTLQDQAVVELAAQSYPTNQIDHSR